MLVRFFLIEHKRPPRWKGDTQILVKPRRMRSELDELLLHGARIDVEGTRDLTQPRAADQHLQHRDIEIRALVVAIHAEGLPTEGPPTMQTLESLRPPRATSHTKSPPPTAELAPWLVVIETLGVGAKRRNEQLSNLLPAVNLPGRTSASAAANSSPISQHAHSRHQRYWRVRRSTSETAAISAPSSSTTTASTVTPDNALINPGSGN